MKHKLLTGLAIGVSFSVLSLLNNAKPVSAQTYTIDSIDSNYYKTKQFRLDKSISYWRKPRKIIITEPSYFCAYKTHKIEDLYSFNIYLYKDSALGFEKTLKPGDITYAQYRPEIHGSDSWRYSGIALSKTSLVSSTSEYPQRYVENDGWHMLSDSMNKEEDNYPPYQLYTPTLEKQILASKQPLSVITTKKVKMAKLKQAQPRANIRSVKWEWLPKGSHIKVRTGGMIDPWIIFKKDYTHYGWNHSHGYYWVVGYPKGNWFKIAR